MSSRSTSAAGSLADAYRRNRERSRALFDLLAEEAYYSRPIDVRHPIAFYEGHLPAFSFNTLVKRALGRPSIDPGLEALFARGIDPPSPHGGYSGTGPRSSVMSPCSPQNGFAGLSPPSPQGGYGGTRSGQWPERAVVQAFADEADRQVLQALTCEELERPGHPMLDRAEAAFAIVEHERMHQETLLYMWHQLPHNQKRRPTEYVDVPDRPAPPEEWVDVSGGDVTLGKDREEIEFGWDNEFPRHAIRVGAFRMQRLNVTNEQFLEFVEAGGYADPQWWRPEDWMWVQRNTIGHPRFIAQADGLWWWRGMFEWIPLPASWPVYVTHAEASAFARWAGARLPTEAEFHRAAFGTPAGAERAHPWGDAPPDDSHGVFGFTSWDPQPVGSHPAGRSSWGIDDLVGNGWEWTSTPFAPFPGFTAMGSYPEYSADFFDGQHYVMKGASPATPRELLRPSFRNWFRPQYPFMYATFRLVQDARR